MKVRLSLRHCVFKERMILSADEEMFVLKFLDVGTLRYREGTLM